MTTVLHDIQTEYFDIVESLLMPLHRKMQRQGSDPFQVAVSIAEDESQHSEWAKKIEESRERLRAFWDIHSITTSEEVRQLSALKYVYGGDVSPLYTSNIASSVGLYADTIIIPDPVFKGLTYPGTNLERNIYTLIKHGLNILTYKEVALAQVTPPILAVVPHYFYLYTDYQILVHSLGSDDVLPHMSKVFGRAFSSNSELQSYLSRFDSYQSLSESVLDPTRVLSNIAIEGVVAQLERFEQVIADNFTIDNGFSPGNLLKQLAFSRFVQATDVVVSSSILGGIPFTDAEASWKYMSWKYEYLPSSYADMGTVGRTHLINKVLQVGNSEKLQLLRGLPVDILIELRKQNAMQELRDAISKGIHELDELSLSDIVMVTENVSKSLENMFTKHQSDLADLATKKGKYYRDLSKFIGLGTFQLLSSISTVTPLKVGAVLSRLLIKVPTATDVLDKRDELRQETAIINRSPAAIFIKHIKQSK